MASLREEPSWPPTAAEHYLPDVTPHRPLFQGDVFTEVPFIKARSAGNPARDPNVTIERRTVALLGYPCDVYDQGRPVKVQSVSLVVDAQRRGVPANWDGTYTLCPLPDLHGDGVMWAADLGMVANIDVSYLNRAKRVRALSEDGWAVFRQRVVLTSTRTLVSIPKLRSAGRALWAEVDLWHEWNKAGVPEHDFQEWLDGPEPSFGGFTRRTMLERGMEDEVHSLMTVRLATRTGGRQSS